MAFIKIQKNKAYFKRYQVKNRRRREGKTDYQQRTGLVKQDKNKYNTPKYRLVARFTNKRCICQIVWSTIIGDKVLARADSTELAKYGITLGLTNYAAGYATGLLVARRALKVLKLDKTFTGVAKADGELYRVEDEDCERRPFKCFLDVGLTRTTVGNRVFGCLKGAVDGGLHIPHTEKRFPGYSAPEVKGDDAEYHAETHRERILAGHVCDYMEHLKEEDEPKYQKQFSRYIKAGVDGEALEDMYLKAHDMIRADPAPKPKKDRKVVNTRVGKTITTNNGNKYVRNLRLNAGARKGRVKTKQLYGMAKATRA